MRKISYYIFIIWFLLLPFTLLSSMYLGMAIDKKIAPMLIILWFFLYLIGNYKFNNEKIFLLLIALSFFFVRNLSFISDSSVYIELIWEDAIRFGYFAIPILFLNSNKKVKTATRLISISAMVGCVSAFLVAMGILTLPYERFSQSRIGFEDIQKSIGLFTSYGDTAQYAAYFLMLGFILPFNLISIGRSKKIIWLTVLSIVVMGLIGTQSRSYLLSIITAIIMAALFHYRNKKTTNTLLFNVLLFIVGANIIAIIGFMFNDIVNVLSGLGGAQALGTAEGRLGQYQLAFSLIKEHPFLGVDADFYLKNGFFGHFVHNMWLGQIVRGGFISAVILLGLLLIIFKRTMSLFASEDTQLYAIISIGYISAVFVSTLFYPADSMLFWAMLGMNAAIIYTLKPEDDNTVCSNKESNSQGKLMQSSVLRYRD